MTVFPDNANAIVYRTGTVQTVVSALDRSILHRCGREYFWWCPHCQVEVDTDSVTTTINLRRVRGIGRVYDVPCHFCTGPLRQRVRLSTGDSGKPVD